MDQDSDAKAIGTSSKANERKAMTLDLSSLGTECNEVCIYRESMHDLVRLLQERLYTCPHLCKDRDRMQWKTDTANLLAKVKEWRTELITTASEDHLYYQRGEEGGCHVHGLLYDRYGWEQTHLRSLVVGPYVQLAFGHRESIAISPPTPLLECPPCVQMMGSFVRGAVGELIEDLKTFCRKVASTRILE
ncbi:MAG: hypothetical protein Q9207_008259 [Kuettlingeria erythrocarpa]